MTVLRHLIVLLQLQTAFGAAVQASDHLFFGVSPARTGRWVVYGCFNNRVVDVFCLLPQSIPEVFISLCFGHCFQSNLTAAPSSVDGMQTGLERVTWRRRSRLAVLSVPVRRCVEGIRFRSLPLLRRRRRRRRVEPADGNSFTAATDRHWTLIRSAPHRPPVSDSDELDENW